MGYTDSDSRFAVCLQYVTWAYTQKLHASPFSLGLLHVAKTDKKLSYPQRKCASNVAILYGADGISI